MSISLSAFSQRAVSDTLQGNETVVFDSMLDANMIQVVCTELGGTSDGSLILKASVDGVSFVTVSEKAGAFEFYPNDTLTIVDGAGWLIDVKGSPFKYYEVVGTGTASDTTLVSIKWAK